ncbi:MAG: hypothetical protein ACTSSH_00995 [Candidatus Heimdallarchaeota archaeon]
MIKSLAKCSICGKMGSKDEMILYNFPTGPKTVCRRCYQTLPPDPMRNIPRPDGKKRPPESDFFPHVE